jgi:hypothetical protein
MPLFAVAHTGCCVPSAIVAAGALATAAPLPCLQRCWLPPLQMAAAGLGPRWAAGGRGCCVHVVSMSECHPPNHCLKYWKGVEFPDICGPCGLGCCADELVLVACALRRAHARLLRVRPVRCAGGNLVRPALCGPGCFFYRVFFRYGKHPGQHAAPAHAAGALATYVGIRAEPRTLYMEHLAAVRGTWRAQGR